MYVYRLAVKEVRERASRAVHREAKVQIYIHTNLITYHMIHIVLCFKCYLKYLTITHAFTGNAAL